mgnify:CR=1 FL=1
MSLPTPDPLDLYLDLFERISRRSRWKLNVQGQRIIAMVLATVPLDDPMGTVEEAAAVLRKKAGWFGPLRSPVRYSVAAMLIRRGLPPGRVHDQVISILKRFKGRGLPWGGPGRVLAAVLLALRAGESELPEEVLERMGRIHRLWKADHPVITGDDDFPMLALHALGDESPGALSDRIEATYRELHHGGFPRGNALQLSTQILGVLPWSAGEAAGRFHAVRNSFRRFDEKIGRSRFDEVALLSLAPGSPDEIVEQVLTDRDKLRARKPRPSKEVSFSLASGLLLSRMDSTAAAGKLAGEAESADLPEIAALSQVRAVLEAQQAAMSAALLGSMAAQG